VTISYTGPTFVSFSGSTFTFTPSTSFSGSYAVTVNLDDGITALQSFSFNVFVTVPGVNNPPTFQTPLVN